MDSGKQHGDGQKAIAVHVAPALGWLAPVAVDDLIRIGGDHDGGYVIPSALLSNADVLISMGLGYSWRFEQEARALNPRLRVQVYDHTVSERLYARQFAADVVGVFVGQGVQGMVRRYRRLRDYRRFFGSEATHYRERINDRRDKVSVDIATVFERAGSGSAFVKMDIEGSEYRVLEDVLAYADRILGLAVEFHDVGPLRPVFERIMSAVQKRFEIVHLHANNFVPLYRDGFPDALEITFGRKDLCQPGERRRALPLPGLDQPNDPNAPEFNLIFD